MRIAFDFLSKPIELFDNEINVLCIENKVLFRNTIDSFIKNTLEENGIILSKNFKPIDFKKYAYFIYDYYNFDFSSSFVKKTYDDISDFCNSELQDEVGNFRTSFEVLFDKFISEFEYDFQYNYDFSLQLFFKACDLRPSVKTESVLDNLTQYILLINKYLRINCFIFANLHLYFSKNEIEQLYKNLCYNRIHTLVLENNFYFDRLDNEKILIIDDDLCEIT